MLDHTFGLYGHKNVLESSDVFFISVIKGLSYVTVTSLVIFLLVFNNLNKVLREVNTRKLSEDALNEAQRIAQIGAFPSTRIRNILQCSDEAMRILELSKNTVVYYLDILTDKFILTTATV